MDVEVRVGLVVGLDIRPDLLRNLIGLLTTQFGARTSPVAARAAINYSTLACEVPLDSLSKA